MRSLSLSQIHQFRKIIYNYFSHYARTLPWRGSDVTPYQILVSEVMLQQTQVARVVEKYEPFIKAFPDFPTLARAPLTQILIIWQGLGYNRRTLYLKKLAYLIVEKYNGVLPRDVNELTQLPGIGQATAASICTFAFNQPTLFIETNIRTVILHHFFKNNTNVSDNEILNLVKQTLDKKNPRRWYWALMDYGSYLKQKFGNLNSKSSHYRKQSPFATSNRRIRGRILTALTKKSQTVENLAQNLETALKKIEKNLLTLQKEGFLEESKGRFALAK